MFKQLGSFKVIHKEYSRFLNQFSPPHALYHELHMIVNTSDINIYILIHVKLVFANFVFLVVFGQLVILSDRALHLMTSIPDYIPLVDIIQVHFHQSFELLIKLGGTTSEILPGWVGLSIRTCPLSPGASWGHLPVGDMKYYPPANRLTPEPEEKGWRWVNSVHRGRQRNHLWSRQRGTAAP